MRSSRERETRGAATAAAAAAAATPEYILPFVLPRYKAICLSVSGNRTWTPRPANSTLSAYARDLDRYFSSRWARCRRCCRCRSPPVSHIDPPERIIPPFSFAESFPRLDIPYNKPMRASILLLSNSHRYVCTYSTLCIFLSRRIRKLNAAWIAGGRGEICITANSRKKLWWIILFSFVTPQTFFYKQMIDRENISRW